MTWWTECPGIPSGTGSACFRVPLVICCCHTPSEEGICFVKWICYNFYWHSCGKTHRAPSSQGTRLPWLGLEWSLVSLGVAVMEGRWAQQIPGVKADMGQCQHTRGCGWQRVPHCGYEERNLLVWEMCFPAQPSIPSLPHIPHTALNYRRGKTPFILVFPSLSDVPAFLSLS